MHIPCLLQCNLSRIEGKHKSFIRILPGALPEIRQVPLSEIPGLVRRDIAPSIESGGKTHDVFISHASEDKEDFVRPLATALIAKAIGGLVR
jgi:hypothetical protein